MRTLHSVFQYRARQLLGKLVGTSAGDAGHSIDQPVPKQAIDECSCQYLPTYQVSRQEVLAPFCRVGLVPSPWAEVAVEGCRCADPRRGSPVVFRTPRPGARGCASPLLRTSTPARRAKGCRAA